MERINRFEQSIASIKEAHKKELEDQEEANKRSLSILRTEMEAGELQVADLEGSLMEKDEEMESLVKELDSVRLEKRKLGVEVEKKRMSSGEELRKLQLKYDKEKQDLANRLKDLVEEKRGVSLSLREAREKLREKEKIERRESDEIEKLRSENGEISRLLADSRTENTEKEKRLDYVTEELKWVKEQLAIAQEEKAQMDEKLSSMAFKLRQTQSEAEMAKFHELEEEKASYCTELEKMRTEVSKKDRLMQEIKGDLEKMNVEATLRLKEREHQVHMLSSRLNRSEVIRRNLHNKVMELKGNIRVFCRVRPVLPHEYNANSNQHSVYEYPDYEDEKRTLLIYAGQNSSYGYNQGLGPPSGRAYKKFNFDFDLVFGPSTTQGDLFVEVSALVQSAVDGYRVCIFAYGQTGSGKTYTMQGEDPGLCLDNQSEMSNSQNFDDQHTGLVTRSIRQILNSVEDHEQFGWRFCVHMEMMEIYNDTIIDLFASSSALQDKISIRLNAGKEPVVSNLQSHQIHDLKQAKRLLAHARARRSTKRTLLNKESSRSHFIITIRITGVNETSNKTRDGVLHLVDLAGSERLQLSGSGEDPLKLKEATAINKSLSSLGNVISAIANKEKHIPFRDSKLTHLLQSSLGGDCKTLMICTLSPLSRHRDESLNSLRFAKKANSCEIAYSTTLRR